MLSPAEITDKPVFWLAVAVIEVAIPMIIPNKRWAGVTMLAVGAILLASAYGPFPSVYVSSLSVGALNFIESPNFLMAGIAGNLLSCGIYSYWYGWSSNRALVGSLVVIAAWTALLRATVSSAPTNQITGSIVVRPPTTPWASDSAQSDDKVSSSIQAPPPATSDLRLAPFAQGSKFFDGFTIDTHQSFKMICFPYDPSSCNIAARYRDRFADFWTPDGSTVFDQSNPATFRGFSILAISEKRPSGALLLRERFRSVGIEPQFPIVTGSAAKQLRLGPNDFAVWVSGQP